MGGSAVGHVIPGLALFFWGVFLAFSYAKVHQRAWTFEFGLKMGAAVQLVGSSIAVGQELIGGFSINDPLHNKDHLTLHSMYFFAGIVFLTEAKGWLPRDSWKVALSFTNSCIGLLLSVHASMQMMEEHHPMEGFSHWLLSLAHFGCAAGFALSWTGYKPIQLGTMFMGIMFIMVQGEWLLFQSYALYSGDFGDMGQNLNMAVATSLFIWLLVLTTAMLTMLEVCFHFSAGYDVTSVKTVLGHVSTTPYAKVDSSSETDAMLA